jgi:flagellar protein FlaG
MNSVNVQAISGPQSLPARSAQTVSLVTNKELTQGGTVETAVSGHGQGSSVDGNNIPLTGKDSPVNNVDLNQAVSELNKYVQNVHRDLLFSVDQDSGNTVIKVIDSESKETIRQIPAEEVLQVAKSIRNTIEGNLLKVTA